MSVSLHSDYVAISEFKRVSMFLLLQVLALLWFCVTPGDASSDRLMGDDSLAGHIDKSDYWAQSEYSVTDEKPPGGGNPPREEKDAVEPITRKLPIWGQKIREMGYDLPLPFGLGTNFTWMDQGIDIRNLKIGIGGPNAEPGIITFNNARSRDTALTMRLDTWILPFANVYGIFGYIDGKAELDVNLPGLTINVPGIGEVPIFPAATFPLDVEYDGSTYGGGLTLAGGYKNIFGSLDANYTFSKINVVKGEIETVTISPRLGVRVNPSSVKWAFAFWVGAMYMDYKQTVTDDVNLRELDPRLPSVDIEFEVELENDKPWNFLFGGQWEITKRWHFMAEGGIGERKQFIGGLFFRF